MRVGEVTQLLRTHNALAEDSGSAPRQVVHYHLYTPLVPGDLTASSSGFHRHSMHVVLRPETQTDTHLYAIKIYEPKKIP